MGAKENMVSTIVENSSMVQSNVTDVNKSVMPSRRSANNDCEINSLNSDGGNQFDSNDMLLLESNYKSIPKIPIGEEIRNTLNSDISVVNVRSQNS